jgi:hypothetical protein
MLGLQEHCIVNQKAVIKVDMLAPKLKWGHGDIA